MNDLALPAGAEAQAKPLVFCSQNAPPALAGILWFDLRPIDSGARRWLSEGAEETNPGDSHVCTAPGLLMAGQEPPEKSLCGNICTFYGRLDNRRDLLAACSDGGLQPPSNAALALALYEKRGIEALRELIGDWSLALWDNTSRTMLLASDYAGIRPLYYHRSADCLVWSSALRQLVPWVNDAGLDDDYVTDLLTAGLAVDRTPYRGIYPVTPGAAVRVSRERLDTARFWHLPIHECIRYPHETEYEEQLRVLFEESVAARLQTAAPVCAELSGGLDSSSIVCMADRLIAAGAVPARSLTTFSYCERGSNDHRFIQAVEQACNVSPIHLDTDDYPLLTPACAGGAAPALWAPRLAEVSRQMAGIGSTALLSGQLGDLIMGNWLDDSEQASDCLRQGQLWRGIQEAFAWSQSLEAPVYSILWRAMRGGDPDLSGDVPRNRIHGDSLTARFRDRARARQRDHSVRPLLQGACPTRKKRLRALHQMLSSRFLQSPEALCGASYAHPYLHRPLVEFLLAIPPAVVCRPGEPRRLMRRALKGLVPEVIRRRRSKGNYEEVFLQSLRACAAELFQNGNELRLVELGYLDGAGVRGRLRRLIDGLPCNEGQLRHVILLEVWLRQRSKARAASNSRGLQPAAPVAVAL
ncbi:MAG TPA: asparagine synthase-related protein [Bryobacteraceae bacterium]|nr:asparagine synthase-related protein [Bryobacteraceae bacterium]